MEKDLRDAYAALKLLRADLVKTRRDKRALEASLTYLQTHGPPPSAVQAREGRETQLMQHEDINCQLLRLAAKYETRLSEMEIDNYFYRNNCQKEETPEDDDNQLDENDEGVEKLALLNKLHSLTATVEQQTQTMLVQQAAFAMQRGELETRLEDAETQLQAEKTQVADAVLDQQTMKEKYEFLETQVEILKEEKQQLQKKLAAHAQTNSILQQQLEEKEELSRETEKGVEEAREDHESALCELENNCKELQSRFESLEAERAAEARNHEEKLVEVREQYDLQFRELETELEGVKSQLVESERNRGIETTQLETKLGDVIKELQEEQAGREQAAVTVRSLEKDLAAIQSQLAASEVNLKEQMKKAEEELAFAIQKQQDEEERQGMTRSDLESNFEKLQEKLAAAETERLSQVENLEATVKEASQLAIQHEKAVHALTVEKEALQHEVREVQQTSNRLAEKFMSFQSATEQTIQGQLRYIAQGQGQCQSLESQLLAAEDHREPRETKSVSGSFNLTSFHGLSDNEVAALPSSKSWALLCSGIFEMDDFVPQLQALLSIIHESLTLCKSYADILPTLCERIEGKGIDEKGQRSILLSALNFLRIARVLKHCINQEEAPVTRKTAQIFHRRVLNALAQWYECDSNPGVSVEMPTPTFTITSRETALILHNWTRDRTKQVGVRRWLARMEAYPGVPPLRGMSSNRVLELPPDGCTLELEDMTPEVKDAFLLLLIPILKQNRALYVRVFTRYTGGCEKRRKDDSQTSEDSEKVWAMRIHVQSAITVPRARPIEEIRPATLSLTSSPRCIPSPLAPTSPASSVSSSTSSTASSRLQIIQERLQYLHNSA